VTDDGAAVAINVSGKPYVAGLDELVRVSVVGDAVAAMVIDRLCAAETLPAVSVAVTLKLNGLPVAVVGVPLIAPVAVFSVKPGGNEPEATAHV
jgi:hypothetical protein